MIRSRTLAARAAAVLLAVALASVAVMAAPRQAVPRSGGGSPRMGGGATRAYAPSHGAQRGAVAARGQVAPRGQVPGRGTANGIARYGYGSSYYNYGYPCYGWGYPYYGGYYPYWGVGFYGSWGWPWYGDYGYGPYAGYGPTYVMGDEASSQASQAPATIVTQVSPSNAEVLLDGQPVGFVKDYNGRWDELTTSPGHHTITFRSEGYTSLSIELDARPAARYVFDNVLVEGTGEEHRSLPPPPTPSAGAGDPSYHPVSAGAPRGRLKVRAQPEDAAVYLDGEYLGMAGELVRLHGAIPVATGPHKLEIVRPGYASDARTIDVGGDAVAQVDVALERAP